MKKLYSLIAATAIVFSASAQRSVNQLGSVHVKNAFTPSTLHNAGSRTFGDTLFYFDGEYFEGLGIDGTFNYGNDDVDGLTIHSTLQSAFDVTSAWRFFYDLNSVTGDTNSFLGATSWFDPAGQADNWFEIGPIAIPAAGATLSWKHNIPDGDYRDGYNVFVSQTGLSNYTDFTDPAIFSVTDMDPSTATDTANFPDNVWYPRSADLSAYAGQSIYIAFQHYSHDQFILYLDDILVTEGLSSGINETANGTKISQNMPNPFSSVSTINYELAKSAPVVLSVYDVTGSKVAEQNEGTQMAGSHSVTVNAANLSAGVYYYSLKVGDNTSTAMKMVVVK